MDDKRKVTTLRINRELYERIAEAAAEEGRSVNQQMVYIIRQALNARAST